MKVTRELINSILTNVVSCTETEINDFWKEQQENLKKTWKDQWASEVIRGIADIIVGALEGIDVDQKEQIRNNIEQKMEMEYYRKSTIG